MKEMNPDIPIEALYQQLLKENKRLQIEIGMLKAYINEKETAIEAFKVWQKKVQERNGRYWLNEYIKTFDTPSDISNFQNVISLYYGEEAFSKKMKQFIVRLRDHMITHGELDLEDIKRLNALQKEAGFIRELEKMEKKMRKFNNLKKKILEAFPDNSPCDEDNK